MVLIKLFQQNKVLIILKIILAIKNYLYLSIFDFVSYQIHKDKLVLLIQIFTTFDISD